VQRSKRKKATLKVLPDGCWLSVPRILADLLSFVFFAVLSRAFGPGGTGTCSYGFALATLSARLSISGFRGLRHPTICPRRRSAVHSLADLRVLSLQTGGTGILSEPLAHVLRSPRATPRASATP
jgi:hypothetical protein